MNTRRAAAAAASGAAALAWAAGCGRFDADPPPTGPGPDAAVDAGRPVEEGGSATDAAAPGCVSLAEMSLSSGALEVRFAAGTGASQRVASGIATATLTPPAGRSRAIVELDLRANVAGDWSASGYMNLVSVRGGADPQRDPTVWVTLAKVLDVNVFPQGFSGPHTSFGSPAALPMPSGEPFVLTVDVTWAPSGAVRVSTNKSGGAVVGNLTGAWPALGSTITVGVGGNADLGTPAVELSLTGLCARWL